MFSTNKINDNVHVRVNEVKTYLHIYTSAHVLLNIMQIRNY